MAAQGPHIVTEHFEHQLAKYTGAKYAVCVDNQSNALWLSLMYERYTKRWNPKTTVVKIPASTYPSVPCEIRLAGGQLAFMQNEKFDFKKGHIKGSYNLIGTSVVDSALRFTANMYIPGKLICLSFTGPHKHLKLGKGGCILTDNSEAYYWLKKARNSGRSECSYHHDNFTMLGRNCYMTPDVAARGVVLMPHFYELDGKPKENPDIELPYPDLSKFKIYTMENPFEN